MRRVDVALAVVLVLLCTPAWAKGKGEGNRGKAHSESTIPDGARPPGLAERDDLPKGLEKKDKTPAGWKHGKKKGWFRRMFEKGE